MTMRRAGDSLLLPDDEAVRKADLLTKRLREVFREQDVKILRATKQVEVRIVNLDKLMEVGDIIAEFARLSGTREEEIRAAPIRYGRSGFGSTLVRCPVECAIKIAETGRVQVRWTSARIELLGRRLPKCYWYMAIGHVQARCPSKADGGYACLNCGEESHMVSDCKSEAWYRPYAERGFPAGHRTDSRVYPPWAPTKEVMKHPRKEGVLHQKVRDSKNSRPPKNNEEDTSGKHRDYLSPCGGQEDAWEMIPEERKKKKKRRIEEDADKTADHRRATTHLDEAMEAETEGTKGMTEVR